MPVLRSGGGASYLSTSTRNVHWLAVPPPAIRTAQSRLISTYVDLAIGTTVAITSALMAFTGQATAANARKNVLVTSASMAMVGVALLVNARRLVVVAAASIAMTGQSIAIRMAYRIVALAAQVQYAANNLQVGTGLRRLVTHIWIGFRLGF